MIINDNKISSSSKQSLLEDMPGLISSCVDLNQDMSTPQYCVSLGVGPQWYS